MPSICRSASPCRCSRARRSSSSATCTSRHLSCSSTASLQRPMLFGTQCRIVTPLCRLAPCYMGRAWNCLGNHVLCLWGALISSITTASACFSMTERAINSFTLHYIGLLHCCMNRRRFGSSWETRSIALVTLRNISITCAGAIASCLTAFEPVALQELRIEEHFGAVKSHTRGTAGVRDLLLGTAT